MSILELFTDVDDFCLLFEPAWALYLLQNGEKPSGPKRQMYLSEIMTILIYFHQSDYRCFKKYYTKHVQKELKSEFPNLVSYSRFVEYTPGTLVPLCSYMRSRLGQSTGINFVDATPLPVCHNLRIPRHKVFAKLAKRGKTSMGWFYGFKLHLIVNDCGEILSFHITPANVDDREPVPHMAQDLWGKLFGDKGYIAEWLTTDLLEHHNLRLVTPIKKNMKPALLTLLDRIFSRKRSIIETINDQLKNISQISHTRHRSPHNFLVNVLCGLISYSWQPQKPSLNLRADDLALPALV
ncbi:IS982 family transposase [Chloroflexi bacterium TSY]|nr:IS982 family transposase [Chloroflexi bacterium TSY]